MQTSNSKHMVILAWEPENLLMTSRIKEQLPHILLTHFCLATASQRLLEESASADPSIRPGRYVFSNLLSASNGLDDEAIESRERLKDLLLQTSILVTPGLLPPTPDLVPNLELVHLLSAGIDMIAEHPLFKHTSIDFTTSSGIHGIPLSEWTLMTVLAFQKNLAEALAMQQRHEWPRNKSAFSRGSDLYGKRVGIIGYGSIGRQIARAFSSFGCSILALTALPRLDREARKDHGFTLHGTGDPSGHLPTAWFHGTDKASLHNFLSQGLDFLVLSLPLTPASTNMLSAQEFEILASHPASGGKCFLINVSRGRTIDQSSLIHALNNDLLAGAALDVATPEPLPTDSPLWSAKNVVITPHISTLTSNYQSRAMDILVSNLQRKLQGEKMVNLVDRARGY